MSLRLSPALTLYVKSITSIEVTCSLFELIPKKGLSVSEIIVD